ncbi:MAG TPA: sigma-70 family RNA polymerase sigma factor, partial [Bacteroidia bacterium]|nr:sigma-70 family RNA polymerase sigma factor [Bacteroidia bacterium]
MDISKYYEQICKEPMLSREEEFDAFMLMNDPGLPQKERDKIREKIIKANLRFCFKQAKRYSKNDPEVFEELISAANEGLLVGIEKFDPARGVRFLTLAGWWVLQRLLKEMSKKRIVALPVWRQQLAARIQKACDNKENMTIEELKKEFPDVAEKDLIELYDTKYLTYYIEDMDQTDPAFEVDPIGTEVEARIDRDRLNAVVESLPSPHREVISYSFGLNDYPEQTHSQISAQLGLTKDQIREYKAEGLGIIKDRLAGS